MLNSKKGIDPIKIKKEIQNRMWKGVGVVRNEKQMGEALKKIYKLRNKKVIISGNLKMNKKLIAALDIKNMFPICEMIIKSALFRRLYFR